MAISHAWSLVIASAWFIQQIETYQAVSQTTQMKTVHIEGEVHTNPTYYDQWNYYYLN